MNKTHKSLRIIYDRTLKILTVSPSAWTAAGPSQWFDSYKIISTIDNPLTEKLNVIDIGKYYDEGAVLPATTKEIMASPKLEVLVKDCGLEGYRFVSNRPTEVRNDHILANERRVANQYENKVWFRKEFGKLLHFPAFRLVKLDDFERNGISFYLEALHTDTLIVQHPFRSGGRGTLTVANNEDFINCCESLRVSLIDEDIIVVSEKIASPEERTIQVCITEEEIFIGPAQAQLVGHPLLTSSRWGDIQFCGGRIAPDLLTSAQYQVAKGAVDLVGNRLKQAGYRGIFGMDFLVSKEEIYILEVNPRMTGLTPLLAFLQTEVPFLLLHILELSHVKYDILNATFNTKSGSFIQVYAQQEGVNVFETGTYDTNGVRVGDGFEDGNMIPANPDNFFVGMRVSKDQVIHQGKSLAFIYSSRQLFDDAGTIIDEVDVLISKIQVKSANV